jgi:hypothetical protein
MKYSLIQQLNQLATDRWARQGVRTLLRAATLAASIWCIGLGGHLLWGWPLRIDILGALALVAIGVGVLLLLRPRMSAQQAARRLDRRFHLDEQLATAIETVATKPPPDSVGARLVAQSGHTARLLSQRIARRQRPPWNELITLAMLLPVVLGLYILSGIGSLDIGASPLPLPPLVSPEDPALPFAEEPPPQQQAQAPGGDPGAGTPGESGAPGQQPGAPGEQQAAGGQPSASGDPRTMEALADALRDQGATRPAADALDRGDPSGAAQQLRELADQADQLSQDAREDMADSLRDAADRIEANDPALADQLRDSADGLEQGGQDAAQALDDLARAIEDLQDGQQTAGGSQGQPGQDGQGGEPGGQDGQGGEPGDQPGGQGGQDGQGGDGGQAGGPGGAGSGAGEQRQSESSERLGVPGQPVPLETDGPGDVPAEPSDRPPTSSEVVPGTTSGEASSDQRVQTGADPLRVPLDERDVVQDYFQN